MGSCIDILDTQKKSEFQGIPNFKDSEFEETKCISSITLPHANDSLYYYMGQYVSMHGEQWFKLNTNKENKAII